MPATDPLSVELVYQLAPDAKGAQAGLKLVGGGHYAGLSVTPDQSRLWASCQGSDTEPYRVALDLATVRRQCHLISACNCPSFKRPCKHALGLLLAYVQAPGQFQVRE